MQSLLLLTTYAYDRQQVIYIFDKLRVKTVIHCNAEWKIPLR